MFSSLYWLGVILAIFSGVIGNCGLLLQKKVIIGLPDSSKFIRRLIKNPIWLFGLFLNFGIGSLLFFFAQIYIGPTLVPGLLDVGIIVLALGSIKLIGDKLKSGEILAMLLMISATFFLSFSGLSIEISETNFLELGFVFRFTLFSIILFLLIVGFQIFQNLNKKVNATLLSISSGLGFSLSDFWIAPFIGVLTHLFGGTYYIGEVFLLVISSLVLILSNIIGIVKLQESFKYGVASNMVTIQQIPLNISPIIMYLFIFLLTPPNIFSIIFLIMGSILIIISSFLLGKRQMRLDGIN